MKLRLHLHPGPTPATAFHPYQRVDASFSLIRTGFPPALGVSFSLVCFGLSVCCRTARSRRVAFVLIHDTLACLYLSPAADSSPVVIPFVPYRLVSKYLCSAVCMHPSCCRYMLVPLLPCPFTSCHAPFRRLVYSPQTSPPSFPRVICAAVHTPPLPIANFFSGSLRRNVYNISPGFFVSFYRYGVGTACLVYRNFLVSPCVAPDCRV